MNILQQRIEELLKINNARVSASGRERGGGRERETVRAQDSEKLHFPSIRRVRRSPAHCTDYPECSSATTSREEARHDTVPGWLM